MSTSLHRAFGPGESELNFKLSRFAVNLPPCLLLCQSYNRVHGVQTPTRTWSNYRTQLSVTALNMIKGAVDFQRAYMSRLYIRGPAPFVSVTMCGPLSFACKTRLKSLY